MSMRSRSRRHGSNAWCSDGRLLGLDGVTNKDVGSNDGYPGDLWHYARFRLVMACRAAGIDPVDGPFADFRNAEAYREECRRSMILGCVGKWAIHPRRSTMRWRSTRPSRRTLRAPASSRRPYAEAERKGLGAINIDGVMVDVASIRILRNTILNKADLYGM